MYKQLTQEERYMISSRIQVGFNQTKIAIELGVNKSTISRELKRNKGGNGYRPIQANKFARERRQICRKPTKLTLENKQLIITNLQKNWSPEQISGRLELEYKIKISHETIYKYIYDNKANGGSLYKHLRHQKTRRKKYGSGKRHLIKDKNSIDNRPAIVEKKERIGDWEIDTIVGAKNQGPVLITLVDRFSKYTIIAKAESKHASIVAKKIIRHFAPIKDRILTITSDNGLEFAKHKKIAKKCEADFYFCHPYSSWERGLNENTNGLIRQYLPKKTTFFNVNDRRINRIECYLNSRPRKSLGYKTPKEVFFNQSVALGA